jgi:hypothetical protein
MYSKRSFISVGMLTFCTSTGTWSGFHWTETQKPFHPMLSFTVTLDNYGDGSESETAIIGDGVSNFFL